MDMERAARVKKCALAKRASLVERIKFIFDAGVSGELDEDSRQRFLITVNDLSDLWEKFVIENNAVLEAMVDLGEDQSFSSSEELEANRMLISAKALANRFSLATISREQVVPQSGSQPEIIGNSDITSRSVEIQLESESAAWSSHSVRLLQIPLPHFEGDLADWPDFRDRFTALVHNRSTISNVEKFYYLMGCLSTDVSETVKGILVSNDTYAIAWAVLVERYDKPRKLAARLLESMFSALVLQNQSVTSLNKLLSTFDENISILGSLDVPDLGDFILFSLAFRSLPTSSRRLFETTNKEIYIRSQDLFKFIENRVQVLELSGGGALSAAAKNSSFKPSKHGKELSHWQKPKQTTSLLVTKSTGTTATDNSKCLSCDGSHLLKTCSVFKELSVSERFEIISKNRLCMACFSTQHWSNKCSESCSICKRRHHALLHPEVWFR